MLTSIFSRKNEYEADDYAKQNYSGEFFYYSHPTVLKRLNALKG